MEEKGFIVYSHSIFDEGKTYIELIGRTIKGEVFKTRNLFQPYFFIKKNDLDIATKHISLQTEDNNFKDFQGNELIKILFDNEQDKKNVSDILRTNLTVYESDIDSTQQFLNDHDIYSSISIKGEKDALGIYNNPLVTCTDIKDVNLETGCFDIETNKKNEIISISYYSKNIKEVLIVSKEKVKGALNYENEKEMLIAFIQTIKKDDPDILAGWNVIDFDLASIKNRCKILDIDFHIGRIKKDVRLNLSRDFFKTSTADCPGRVILDGINVLKINFVSLENYKLDTAAKHLLKDQKIDLMEEDEQNTMSKWDQIEHLYKTNKEKLALYNLVDSKLVYDILQKDMLKLLIERSKIVGLRIDKVRQSIKSLDSMYIKKAHERKIACYSSFNFNKEEAVIGAFVMQSIPGLYKNLIVLDFKSLYPSIMRTYNIDPLTLDETGKIKCANGIYFKKEQGILPELLETIWKARDKAKKNKDTNASMAYKITMNSFYGSIANPTCRFFSMDIANAITGSARETIKETIKLVEEWGYKVIYSDTDSIFVDTQKETYEATQEIGKELETNINKYFDKKLDDDFKVKSSIEIEFEKTYETFFMPSARDNEKGAKKRYAGLRVIKKGDEFEKKIDITGLEYVRRDWTKLAKELQYKLLESLFHNGEVEEIKEIIKKTIDNLKDNKLDEELTYRKTLNKPVSEYTKTTPPHVKAAKKLMEHDMLHNPIIKYIMTKEGPLPIQLIKDMSVIDHDHYIEKQIKPIAKSILDLFGENFDDIISKTSQKTLFSF